MNFRTYFWGELEFDSDKFDEMKKAYQVILNEVEHFVNLETLEAFKTDWEVVQQHLHKEECPNDSIASTVAWNERKGDYYMRSNHYPAALDYYCRVFCIVTKDKPEYDLVAANISRKAGIAKALLNCPTYDLKDNPSFRQGDLYRGMLQFSNSKAFFTKVTPRKAVLRKMMPCWKVLPEIQFLTWKAIKAQ